MRGLYVDTGVWLALLDAADPLHARARKVIEEHKTYPLLSSDQVLSETVTLLRRELGSKTAAEFGEDFLAGKIGQLLAVEKADWQEGLRILKRYEEHKISAADATSAALIHRLDVERVASFDKHFKVLIVDRPVVG